MLEANVLDKVSPGNRGRHFLGPVYVDWPMLQSNSPESRDSIRVVVVTFVSLSGYREIYVENFSTADSSVIFTRVK